MTGTIRDAGARDHAAIRRLLLAAFEGPAEADLVDRLRTDGDVVLELVATDRDEVAGHVLFSRLLVEGGGATTSAVALAPLAVARAHRRAGTGAGLVEAGHARLRERGELLSVVLGDPAYYGRFGYRHDDAAQFDSDYQCEALQALPFADAPRNGRLRYAAAFAGL